jgi:hypothetical protein
MPGTPWKKSLEREQRCLGTAPLIVICETLNLKNTALSSQALDMYFNFQRFMLRSIFLAIFGEKS